MDTPISPLILTKIRAPSARSHTIPRTRLIQRFNPPAGTRLVLVCAPAGYGKSTLLTEGIQVLQQSGAAVAWYALDASDDAPLPFGSYLVASLMQALGPHPYLKHATQLLKASPDIELNRILPYILNAVTESKRKCVLILDDYHLIDAPAIHSAMAFLLEHLPENMLIFIGSRSDPPLALARLRARGQLLELRLADLRFTPEETSQFLNEIMGLELSAEAVSSLEARTEGWIAGLQLAALSLSNRPDKDGYLASFTGSHRYMVDYLLEEVFSRQTQEVQSFLLSSSILERMCAPLCNTILGDPYDSQAILESVEAANLFLIALDDQSYWYRYHHLFKDFLLSRLLKEQPDSVAKLHRLACLWHASQRNLLEAVDHAFEFSIQTKDWSFAAEQVEQHGYTVLMHSELSTLYEWCAGFPEEVISKRPQLSILQAWAWVLGSGNQNRGKIIARLQQAEQAAEQVQDEPLAAMLKDQVATVRTYLSLIPDPTADPRAQLALAQSQLGVYPEGNAGQYSMLLMIGYAYLALQEAQNASQVLEQARRLALGGKLYFGVAEAAFRQIGLAHAQGKLQQAEQIYQQVRAEVAAMLAHPEQELPGVGCLEIALGCAHLEQDRLEEAQRELLHGLDVAGWGMNTNYLMTACLGLFRLREIQGRSVEACTYLTRLEESAMGINFCTRALRYLHILRMGLEDAAMLAEAASWGQEFISTFENVLPLPGMGPLGGAEAYYITILAWARIQIASGNADEALTLIQRQLQPALENGLTTRVVELTLLEALAWQVQGDNQRAWAALERALAAGEPAGYVHTFNQGPALTRLLLEAANLGIYREYTRRILTAIGQPCSQDKGAEARSADIPVLEFGEKLSQRELEVLQLMGRGASNQEIGKQLVITVGTVKSHINHILAKLSANNRTEAVARAHSLGLLD